MKRKYKALKIVKEGVSFPMAVINMNIKETEELAKVGVELMEVADTNKNDVIEAAKDADIIVRGGVPITRWIMEAAPKCRAIITGSVGFDNIDINAATDNNIIVVNNPASEWCIEEVSNHAITLLLACAKKLTMLDNLVKQGHWTEAKAAQSPMGTIYGQTLGLIGCGAIGRMTAKKAQCFDLKVLGYDPYVEKDLAKKNGITLVNLPELLKESDYVSVHTNLNEETLHLMDEKEFKQMKPNAYFINTSRGSIVNETALIKALEEKWIAGAALDVFNKEPVEQDNPLLKMDNVIALPHSGSYSDAAFSRMPINIAKEAWRVLSGRWPKNVVNKSVKPRVKLATNN